MKRTNRTLDAIYLRPAINMQGGHELYDLKSNRVITRARVTQIPVTNVVIKAIERIAKDQGFKTLKFKNQKGPIFHDADWITGVDYDDNTPQDAEDNEAYDDDENEDPEDDENIDDEYDRIDEDELEDLIEDEREQTNPNQHLEDEEQGEQETEGEEEEPEDNGTAIISEQETESQGSELRRSAAESRPVSRLEPNMSGKSYLQKDDKTKKKVMFAEDELKQLEYCHNLVLQVKPEKEQIIEYGLSQAMLIARFIQDITMNVKQHGASFAQQYILQKGLKVFGKQGHQASKKEIDQLPKRTCFAPLKVKDMKPSKRKRVQMALLFLTEKRDKSVKGRMVYNGKPTREWLSREDAASPTVALESIMITGVIEAKEQRDVMTCDIPNAFIQALLPKKDPGEDRVVMKITGVLVDMLVYINPELYGPAVVLENQKKVLYVEVLKAIYGMLEAALLWYKTFRKDL
jgi:hypothetical protein